MTVEDCRTGVLVRIGNMTDTCYNGATILKVEVTNMVEVGTSVPSRFITVARPFAYASKDFDSKQPLMGCEVFDIYMSFGQFQRTDMEVYEGRDGELRSMAK